MNGEVYEWLKLNIRSITKKLLGLRDQLIHLKPKVVTTPLVTVNVNTFTFNSLVTTIST